jgi:hypothetical protein
MSLVLAAGGLGLGTTLHPLPVSCSIRVPVPWPTAQQSSALTQVTPYKSNPGALVTMLQGPDDAAVGLAVAAAEASGLALALTLGEVATIAVGVAVVRVELGWLQPEAAVASSAPRPAASPRRAILLVRRHLIGR